MICPDRLWRDMAQAKERAAELDDRKLTAVTYDLGDEVFQLQPTGAAGGYEFVLVNDDLRIDLASPKRTWSVIWRGTAAGLWEHGLVALRDRVYGCLERAGFRYRNIDDWCRVVRVDYCFDFESEQFTEEMRPAIIDRFIMPQEVRVNGNFWVKGKHDGTEDRRLQTITVGARGGCQVQIYNKGAEITEQSGKTWMLDVYERDAGVVYDEVPKHLWRVECRMSGDWLKNRTGKKPNEILAQLPALISDALYNRRLTVPKHTDGNRRRWPLHPLYSSAVDEIGKPDAFLPIGRRTTLRRDAMERVLLKNIAGTARSLTVLKMRGAFDSEITSGVMRSAVADMLDDEDHDKKIERAAERYADIDEAK